MKLYGSPMSPFTARVRFSLYYKDLPFEQIKPSSLGGMKSDAFLAVNPLGKIPVLEPQPGVRIPESDVIVNFLEDAFPQRPLLPQDPVDRARVRAVARICDLYILSRLLWNGLAVAMPISLHRQPATLEPSIVDREYGELGRALDNLEYFMADAGPFAMGSQPTIADGAILPYLIFIAYAEQVLERPELLSGRPKLSGYIDRVAGQDSALARTKAEVDQALLDRRQEVAANAANQGATH